MVVYKKRALFTSMAPSDRGELRQHMVNMSYIIYIDESSPRGTPIKKRRVDSRRKIRIKPP